jgi:hypothetical protein
MEIPSNSARSRDQAQKNKAIRSYQLQGSIQMKKSEVKTPTSTGMKSGKLFQAKGKTSLTKVKPAQVVKTARITQVNASAPMKSQIQSKALTLRKKV